MEQFSNVFLLKKIKLLQSSPIARVPKAPLKFFGKYIMYPTEYNIV